MSSKPTRFKWVIFKMKRQLSTSKQFQIILIGQWFFPFFGTVTSRMNGMTKWSYPIAARSTE